MNENIINYMNNIENTNYVSQDTLDELNTELGRIWRIIIANETFCNEYGGVSFTDEPVQNLYKAFYICNIM